MKNYKNKWTEFEVQSLAYSILRKHLYPKYLVRGEYKFDECRADIAIFRAFPNKDPELVLIVEVKKSSTGTSTNQGNRYEALLGVPCVYIRGPADAYKVLEIVSSHLQ